MSCGLQIINRNKTRRENFVEKGKINSLQVSKIEIVKWNLIPVNVLKMNKNPRAFSLDFHCWDCCTWAGESGWEDLLRGWDIWRAVCITWPNVRLRRRLGDAVPAFMESIITCPLSLEFISTRDSGTQERLPKTEDIWAEDWVRSLLCSPGVSECVEVSEEMRWERVLKPESI